MEVVATGAHSLTVNPQISDNTTVVFNNAATEILAHPAASNAVNITSAGSASQAIHMAAASALTSETGGVIRLNTGVIDWFQFGGDTYIVEDQLDLNAGDPDSAYGERHGRRVGWGGRSERRYVFEPRSLALIPT